MIPAANLRQSNCYYSSSDAAFSDRYEAFDNYDGVKNGEVRLDGGWRVYSSGPGIWTRLLMQNFLGLRRGSAVLSVDPVIPPALDGLRAEMMWDGHQITVVYHVRGTGCDTKAVTLNGTPLPYTRRRNPYRQGAVEVSTAVFGKGLTTGANQLGVHLG
jgi:cellobiose phosphorylase